MRQSAITQFQKCPYKYKLQYIDNLKTIPNNDASNALIIGTAIHYGAETESIENMLKNYYSNFNILTDAQINEAIKLEYLLPQVLNFIKQFENVEHEVPFQVGSFHGTADLLVHNKDGTVDLYDYKYSNNIEDYMKSPQLHIYKYFLELSGYKVNKMAFIFIPKTFIRQKKTEDLYQFRRRLTETLKDMKIQIKYLEYDQSKVTNSLITAVEMLETKEFKKNPSRLCDWCEYKKYCFEGVDYEMALPKNERVAINESGFMKGWLYGKPFSGKTTVLDSSPDPLNLNTDGNVKYVTMQRLPIKDEVIVEGRITKRKFAWEVFKEAIDDLEKGSSFKTIIVDLVEDTREMCRLYMYDKLGIQHESDSGFGKGWDIIKTEYLSTMRRMLNLPYNVFLVSHEDTSKDLTKKTGDKITRIAPNIQEAIANKLAGMVDFVARVVVNEDDSRTLSFKQNEVTFGGGRLEINEVEIPLKWDELMKVYDEANEKANKKLNEKDKVTEQNVIPLNDKDKKEQTPTKDNVTPEESKDANSVEQDNHEEEQSESAKEVEEEPKQEDKKPTRRRRRRKADEE